MQRFQTKGSFKYLLEKHSRNSLLSAKALFTAKAQRAQREDRALPFYHKEESFFATEVTEPTAM